MKLVLCDICGKQIDPILDKRYKLTATLDTSETIYNCDDVCEECIDSINEHIAQLRRKDGD